MRRHPLVAFVLLGLLVPASQAAAPGGNEAASGKAATSVPPGAVALGYTKRVINETPTVADIAPGKNGNYKWFSGQWYSEQVPSLDHYGTHSGVLALSLGGDFVSMPRDFSADVLPKGWLKKTSTYEYLGELSKHSRRIAKEKNCALADMYAALSCRGIQFVGDLHSDFVHLNHYGHEMFADVLEALLTERDVRICKYGPAARKAKVTGNTSKVDAAIATVAYQAIAAADDPFVGDYVGTFHPLGEHGGKPRPEDGKDFKPQVMERQIDLAADHGIAFFTFCWYWNKDQEKLNRQPLHTGLELFLKAKNNRRLKFCLLVANHAGYLLQGADEWGKAAERWLPYFKHPQHVMVDGEPLVIIFNAGNADKEGLAQVQAAAHKAGLPGVAIAGCGNGKADVGFTHSTHYNIVPGYAAKPEARKYAELIEAHQRAWHGSPAQPYMPVLSVGWDKRPWEGDRGLGQAAGWYFPDRTPAQFATALESAVAWMDQHPDQTTAERIVLLYAWNEFGEGGYLAPTKGDPEGAYLKAVKQVVEGAEP